MSFLGRIRGLLSHSMVVYALAAAVLIGLVNYKSTVIERLNAVLDWGDYPARLDEGKASVDERQLRMAVRYYKMVAEIQPDSGEPEAMIAYCYARLGEDALAVTYDDRALAKRPDHFWCEYNRGMLHARMTELEEARASFAQVVGRDIKASMTAAILAPRSLRARTACVITLTCVATALVPQMTTQSAFAISRGSGPARRPVPAIKPGQARLMQIVE